MARLDNNDNVDEEIHISFTARQLVAILAVLITGFSAYPVANLVSPDFRAKAFTSDDGAALQRQIDSITKRDVELWQRLEDLERWKDAHIEWGRDMSITQRGKDATQDAQIQELYRRIP